MFQTVIQHMITLSTFICAEHRINLHLIMTQTQEINLWCSTCLKIYIYA